MRKVLLTGATGFIGRHCLPALLKSGYEVHATFARAPLDGFDGVRWHQSDLLAVEQVRSLVDEVRPTHLLHFAWVVTPGAFWSSPDNFRWVQASLELLQCFAANGGQRAVMAGTCAEYNWKYGYCVEGVTPLEPSTVYGTCKHALHAMQEALAAQSGLSAAWGRIFFPYGPHEYASRLIPSVIHALLQHEEARCSHGRQIRDFLYVGDVAEAFVALLGSEVEGAVNIASGAPVTLKEIIEWLAQRLDCADLVRLGALAAPPDEPPLLVADVRRLREEVGWQPRSSLEQGLDQTLAWWKTHLSVESNL